MLRTIKATVATMMVLALAACGSVTGLDLDKSPAGYDGNGPQTSPDELAPGDGEEGGGGLPGSMGDNSANNQRNRHARPHEVAPGSDQDGGGSEDYFDPAPPTPEEDDQHDGEGGEYTPGDDGDGM